MERIARKTTLAAILLFVSFTAILSADRNFETTGLYHRNGYFVRDNSEIRKSLFNVIISPLGFLSSAHEKTYHQFSEHHRVMFDIRETDSHVYLLFINELNYSYPVYSAGSYIVKRQKTDGDIVQLKIFYRDHPSFFVRLVPQGARTKMDVYFADKRVYNDLILPLPLLDLIREPFSAVIETSKGRVDWNLLLADASYPAYEQVTAMADIVRSMLPTLPDAEDGALDSDGDFVFIESLEHMDDNYGFNCSGFAKWVADGFYSPQTGRNIDIEELKERHQNLRGTSWTERFEFDRDPYFGLDWSRNLALALMELQSPAGNYTPESADIRNVPFMRYIEDVGYPIEELFPVLFSLALLRPGYFYIGSINREFGTRPVLRQHTHIAVLLPAFSEERGFEVVVFERNVETSLSSLKKRYSGDYIHLVGVKATSRFNPPIIE